MEQQLKLLFVSCHNRTTTICILLSNNNYLYRVTTEQQLQLVHLSLYLVIIEQQLFPSCYNRATICILMSWNNDSSFCICLWQVLMRLWQNSNAISLDNILIYICYILLYIICYPTEWRRHMFICLYNTNTREYVCYTKQFMHSKHT